MTRTSTHSVALPYWTVLGLCLAAFAMVPGGYADGRIWLVGDPSPGMPPCEEFYDKWDAPGAPSGLLAMAGFSREVFAAKACLDKNDIPMACKHWQGLLAIVDKIGAAHGRKPRRDRAVDAEARLRSNSRLRLARGCSWL